MLIALMPWSPWVCLVFCAAMGLVGVLTAMYFGARERLSTEEDLALANS